jgi:hypothetical protein
MKRSGGFKTTYRKGSVINEEVPKYATATYRQKTVTSHNKCERAHWYLGIHHSGGTTLVVNTIIMIMHRKQMMKVSSNRCQMRGTI